MNVMTWTHSKDVEGEDDEAVIDERNIEKKEKIKITN